MTPPGRENAYLCDTCQRWIRTVDRDEGVTPMFLSCHATEGCPGTMGSAMYDVARRTEANTPGWPAAVAFEWYRPTEEEIAALPPLHRDHYQRGGLKFRARIA